MKKWMIILAVGLGLVAACSDYGEVSAEDASDNGKCTQNSDCGDGGTCSKGVCTTDCKTLGSYAEGCDCITSSECASNICYGILFGPSLGCGTCDKDNLCQDGYTCNDGNCV